MLPPRPRLGTVCAVLFAAALRSRVLFRDRTGGRLENANRHSSESPDGPIPIQPAKKRQKRPNLFPSDVWN